MAAKKGSTTGLAAGEVATETGGSNVERLNGKAVGDVGRWEMAEEEEEDARPKGGEIE